jgi:hypothetical protein
VWAGDVCVVVVVVVVVGGAVRVYGCVSIGVCDKKDIDVFFDGADSPWRQLN